MWINYIPKKERKLQIKYKKKFLDQNLVSSFFTFRMNLVALYT